MAGLLGRAPTQEDGGGRGAVGHRRGHGVRLWRPGRGEGWRLGTLGHSGLACGIRGIPLTHGVLRLLYLWKAMASSGQEGSSEMEPMDRRQRRAEAREVLTGGLCGKSEAPSACRSLGALRSGDREAHEVFVDRYYTALFRWLHWLTGDREHAADLTQETFVSFWHCLHSANPTVQAHVWLFAVGRNVWRHDCRQQRRVATQEIPEGGLGDRREASSASEVLLGAERAAQVRHAVADLSPDLREALTLRYWQGYAYDQIANVLSISPELARQRAFQGREQLRSRLVSWNSTDAGEWRLPR